MRARSFAFPSMCLSLACVGLPPPPPSEAGSSTADTGPISASTADADTLATHGEASTDTTSTTSSSTGETTMALDPTTGGVGSSSGPPPGCMGPGDCDSNEDCDDGGRCVPACGGTWGEGNYGYCLTQYGDFDTAAICGDGHLCVYWNDPIEQTACSLQGCVDACDCPPPPATGNATVNCWNITGDEMNDCYLSCENGETCPDGMTCNRGGRCMTGVPEVPVYGDCGNLAADCVAPGFCVSIAGGESVCTMGCVNAGECPMAFPPGGNTTLACTDLTPDMAGYECYLSCVGGLSCPDGMTCVNGTACMWPD